MILNRVHDGFNNCSASDFCNIPIKKYQEAYTKCFETKKAEMYDKYSNLSERERFMIYQTEIARICDQQDLESFIDNHINTSYFR